ncbi:MAG: tRNA (adenine-N1)-methyltransferase [Anaerolineae bacterium]|nr:tRNA (adenine-N1)-methyltransferase [Anaerolineae bacterium]
MTDIQRTTLAYGDTVMFVGKDRKTFLRTLVPGGRLQTHFGFVEYDALVDLPYGTRLETHLQQDLWLFRPSLDDLIRHLKRETQIIFPKDLGYILLRLNVQPGVRVIEAGTGSGGLTTVLASMVGAEGHVYSYERRARMQNIARQNIERLGLSDRVTFIERDIAEGFDQTDAHAVFLDVPDPWEYLDQAHRALRGSGFLGCIVPTLNQVLVLNKALHSRRWFLVETEELLLRQYKTVPQRMRPNEQMVGHTGFLVFTRSVIDSGAPDLPEDDNDPVLGVDFLSPG